LSIGAVTGGDLRHFRQILIQQVRQLFGFENVGGLGEICDVREEDRQLLPFGGDCGGLCASKDRLVQLSRQEFAQLGRQVSKQLILFDQLDLCAPKRDESAGDGHHREQNDQPTEIAMEAAHKRHCCSQRRNGRQDVHGHEIGKIEETDNQQSRSDPAKTGCRWRRPSAGTDQSTAPYGIDSDSNDHEIDDRHEGD
jgi:hypothetical protein